MRVKYCLISGWVLFSIHIVLYTAYFIAVQFESFLVFGLKPSNTIDLLSVAIYSSYLLLVFFYVLGNRKKQNAHK